ncbi:MAG: hypothetical protein QXS20_07495 [Candidatus Thorarchaeota archaeon]
MKHQCVTTVTRSIFTVQINRNGSMKRTVVAALVLLVPVMMVISVSLAGVSWPYSNAPTPGVTMNGIVVTDIYMWQDFMPMIPPEGAPFHVVVWINISNSGPYQLRYFRFPSITILYRDTNVSIATLPLSLVEPDEYVVEPNTTVTFVLTNNRSYIFSPNVPEGTLLFAIVEIVWESGCTEHIVSPECPLRYTY